MRRNHHNDFRRKKNKKFFIAIAVIVLIAFVMASDFGGIRTTIQEKATELGKNNSFENSIKKDELTEKCEEKLKNWLEVQETKGDDWKLLKVEKFEVGEEKQAEEFYALWNDIGSDMHDSYFHPVFNPPTTNPISYPLVLMPATFYVENGMYGNQHATIVFICNKDVIIINSEFN